VARKRGAILYQHQAPCQLPWSKRKCWVFMHNG
jgi:hypothetical protein